MKGFFEWFKSNSKMKRWMFLILVGVILMCYSISKILVTDRLDKIADIAIIIAGFVSGFLSIIIGLVYMNKRTLELLVKETDKREKQDLKSLIFNRKVYSQGPKIVVIGGGTGLNTVLKGLKKYTDNLTAIVTVSDYGDKSSDSRKILETLPLEDIKESIIALSTNEDEMDKLLNCKFSNAKLKSLSFGDIYMLAMQNIYSDFSKSVKKSSEVLNITGKVLPVTMEEMKICAELEDGTVVEERSEIPNMVSKKSSKVNRIFVNPTNCRVAPGVVEAIEEADAIIIGPGNLYTNVIPNLLVKGVARAIKNCKGFKIYISNIMTEPGQTNNYSLSDHIKAIVDHVGEGIIDYCIYDTGEIVPEIIRKYNLEGSELVEQDVAKAKAQGMHLLKRDLATVDGEYIRHNSDAVAASIIELICEDLKFRDMQNNPEYMILSDKLKYKKKKIKQNKAHKVGKLNRLDPDKKSKFFSKYQKRISSIKESEEKFKKKNKNNKVNKSDDKKDKDSKKDAKIGKVDSSIIEKESKVVEKSSEKRGRKRNIQEDGTTVKSQLLSLNEKTNSKDTESLKRAKEIEKKQKKDEIEKKEFFEAINKKNN
ncbi:MAG: YvcK family protein [Clostridiales bacterium]|nr:YvcK family protein [Clostridiales bacterium]